MKIYLLTVLSVLAFLVAPGWEERTDLPDDYPRPERTSNSLFYIQRNLNKNTIVYDVNKKEDGSINDWSPIDIYWLRYESEGGIKKDLTWLQSMLAYGYTSKKLEDGFKIKLKPYKDRAIYLKKIKEEWKAIMKINGEDCYITNIYVYADESGMLPDVKYVDIYGRQPKDNTVIRERIFNK